MSDSEFLPQEGPKAFALVWRKVMLDPRGFYRDMPATGGFENPLIFLGVCGFIYFALRVVVFGLPDAINTIFLIALAYIFGPGILMLASQFVFQGEGDYEGTLRLCAYAGACLALAWIPALGILAYVYSLYLIFLGMEKVHRLDTTKAAMTTLVALVVTSLIIIWVLGLERIRHPLL